MKGFLEEKRFKYQELLRWPIFEGRMMTAGIMGMVPRFRYILITESLMDILSIEELKAVVAHEMGHARYRHFFFYLVFFIGFAVVSTGLWDFFAVLLSTRPSLMRIIGTGGSADASFLYFLLALPILVSMVVYFRYVMGFFMRHFERQADLYSALTMGSPRETDQFPGEDCNPQREDPGFAELAPFQHRAKSGLPLEVSPRPRLDQEAQSVR